VAAGAGALASALIGVDIMALIMGIMPLTMGDIIATPIIHTITPIIVIGLTDAGRPDSLWSGI
jgi:hypothetical protein